VISRTGGRRLVPAVVAIAALAAPLVLLVAYGQLLLLLIALVALVGAAARRGLGRDMSSLRSGPTPGTPVGPAARPVLLMNPLAFSVRRVGFFDLQRLSVGRAVKKSISSWVTRSCSSWWTQWEASASRSTRRSGTSSWSGSANSGPR
jgi:hypothetical protein